MLISKGGPLGGVETCRLWHRVTGTAALRTRVPDAVVAHRALAALPGQLAGLASAAAVTANGLAVKRVGWVGVLLDSQGWRLRGAAVNRVAVAARVPILVDAGRGVRTPR